jgi:hypothetical protein
MEQYAKFIDEAVKYGEGDLSKVMVRAFLMESFQFKDGVACIALITLTTRRFDQKNTSTCVQNDANL